MQTSIFALITLFFSSKIVDCIHIESSINHGMVVDAGSTGSRMHVYQWEPRIYDSAPPPITYPLERSNWTQRMRPGISACASNPEQLRVALQPLMDFAMEVLKGKEEYWRTYPIFLGATAGVRELTLDDQKRVIEKVRELFSNKTFCPFLFRPEFARVISGEEEGVYGWTAANFLMGTLQDAIEGSGSAYSQSTFGALDLGGGSTQITFFQPDQQIMQNMFKLQIGAQKHWNLYTHSYLGFGHVSSRERMDQKLVENNQGQSLILDQCLPPGTQRFVTWNALNYTLYGSNETNVDDCIEQSYAIFEKDTNVWCNFVYHNQCSFANIYQPPLDILEQQVHKNFLGFSGFAKAFEFLRINTVTASLTEMKENLEPLCRMDLTQLHTYTKMKPHISSHDIESSGGLDNICFFNSFVIALLNYGYGFPMDFVLHAENEMRDLSISWALGAVIYEVNSVFPWQYIPDLWWEHYSDIAITICIALFVLNLIAFPFSWNSIRQRKRRIEGFLSDDFPFTEIS